MTQVRTVLHSYSSGMGTKRISSMLGLSRNTVKKYLQLCRSSGKSIEELLSLDDYSLHSIIMGEQEGLKETSSTVPARLSALRTLLPDYAKRIKKKGVTLGSLYKEYRLVHPDGYGTCQFRHYLYEYMDMSHPISHIEHKSGDKMYVDFAGDKLSIIDIQSGEQIKVEVFVAILPCSQLTFVEAVMTQSKEDFIRACQDALFYYEGVPAVIVPDNLKAAVIKPSRYEAVLQDDFAAFAAHYGCAVIPARVRKPRDKALVEGAVKLIYRSIYPKLADRQFYDLSSLNAAIRVALEVHNNTNMCGRNYSRRRQYEEIERTSMSALNPKPFELKSRHVATVQKNGYVRLEKVYYSVPYKLIGQKVNILYNSVTVDIYHKYQLVATHVRSLREYAYVYNNEHLASNAKVITDWNPDKFILEARAIHSDVEDYIKHVIDLRSHPEQAYKSCRGILSLGYRLGRKRLINACRWAANHGLYSYKAVEQILASKQDELPLEDESENECKKVTPLHKNIRGKDYYSRLPFDDMDYEKSDDDKDA